MHEAFEDSCTAVTLSLSLGAIEEAMPCLLNHLSSAKIILHVLYVYVISFLKKIKVTTFEMGSSVVEVIASRSDLNHWLGQTDDLSRG